MPHPAYAPVERSLPFASFSFGNACEHAVKVSRDEAVEVVITKCGDDFLTMPRYDYRVEHGEVLAMIVDVSQI